VTRDRALGDKQTDEDQDQVRVENRSADEFADGHCLDNARDTDKDEKRHMNRLIADRHSLERDQ